MPGADTTLRLSTFQIQSKYKISASCAQTLCRKNKKGYVEIADHRTEMHRPMSFRRIELSLTVTAKEMRRRCLYVRGIRVSEPADRLM